MAHRSFSAALTILAACALAAVGGCTANVAGGAGASSSKGNGGSGAGGSSSTGVDDSCTSLESGSTRPCALPSDPAGTASGVQSCEVDSHGDWGWTDCSVSQSPSSSAVSTPLVLSFDGAPVTFASTLGAFDLAVTQSVVTDWPAASTPWLALDRNGNGVIDDGAELFGSATVLGSGERAANGFIALAQLDSNGDGRITPEDAAWSSLRLWSDENADRVSSAAELRPLAARHILSIDLRYTSERRCDARGNCEIERASFRWADESGVEHTGTIVDVHLRHQEVR